MLHMLKNLKFETEVWVLVGGDPVSTRERETQEYNLNHSRITDLRFLILIPNASAYIALR